MRFRRGRRASGFVAAVLLASHAFAQNVEQNVIVDEQNDGAPAMANNPLSDLMKLRPQPPTDEEMDSLTISKPRPPPGFSRNGTAENPLIPSSDPNSASLFESADTTFSEALKNAKTPYEICVSIPFQLNEENFENAKVIDFVKAFTLKYHGTPFYDKYGLLASIGYFYLGRPDYRCGMGYSASCSASCQEVVSNIEDKQLARQVYFTLMSGRHYLQHMEAVDRAISAAAFTVSQWIPQMSFSFFWWRPEDYELMYQMSTEIFYSAMLLGINHFVPQVVPMEAVLGSLNEHLRKAVEVSQSAVVQALIMRYQDVAKAVDNYKVNAATRHQASQAVLSMFTRLDGSSVPYRPFQVWDGLGRIANQLNTAQMSLWMAEVVQDVKRANHWNVNEVILGQYAIYPDGSSPFTMLLSAKAFVQPFEDGNLRFSNFLEHGITRALQFQLFSMALTSQHTYITCTKSFQNEKGEPVKRCEDDKSGPQNMRACVGERVCYMYRWSHLRPSNSQHVDEPHGKDFFDAHPFNIDIKDVIRSSVGTHLERTKPEAIAQLWAGNSFEHIYDAAAPGSFSIPVCIRDEDNWNTPVKPYSVIFDDFNPWSSKKTFPCVCGGAWGNESAEFWARTGLSVQPAVKNYIIDKCPSQVKNKVKDPLERFVMNCRFGVQKRKFLPGYKKERHPMCEVVVAVLEGVGQGSETLMPGLRLELECRLGLIKDRRAKEWCKSFTGSSGLW